MQPQVCLTHLGGGGVNGREMPPWVENDANILRERFRIRPVLYESRRSIPSLAVALLSSDSSLSWFAWDNARWAIRIGKVFRVPAVVIVAGFETASQPEYDYGALRSVDGRRRLKEALGGASRVFAVSRYIQGAAKAVASDAAIDVLYLGFDPREFPAGPPPTRRSAVCTVGDITEGNLRRKGILDVLEVARHLAEVPVLIAGKISSGMDRIISEAPKNVRFLDYVSREELVRVYHSSRVYLQLSRHEGFGASVAEAMLCGCRPVVSRAGALPEVVGEAGRYVELGDPEGIAEAVRREFADEGAGDAQRLRIASHFPISKRREALIRCFEEIRQQ